MFLLSLRQNLAHLVVLTLSLCFIQGATWKNLEDRGYSAEAEGDFVPAEKMYRQALKEARKAVRVSNGKLDYKPLKEVLIRLNYVLVMQSKFAEAEPIYNELLSLLRYKDKYNDIAKEARLALVVDELADAYGMRLNPHWRETVLKHSLALKEEIYGSKSIYLLKTIDALVQYSCQIGKYKQADQYLAYKLAIVKKHKSQDLPLLCSTLIYIAAVKMNEQDYSAAEEASREGLRLAIGYAGQNSAQVANFQRRLGWLAMKQRHYRQAAKLMNAALTTHNLYLSGKDRIAIAQDYFCLAQLAEAENKSKLAEGYYRKTIAVVKQFYPPNSFEFIIPLRSLAKVLARNGKNTEAKQLNTQAAELARASFGETGALFSIHCCS